MTGRYSDGHAYCFSTGCGYFEPATDTAVQSSSFTNGTYKQVVVTEMTGIIAAIPDRRLSKDTCQKPSEALYTVV